MPIIEKYIAAIRKTDDHEWIDTTTIAGTIHECNLRMQKTNKDTGFQWSEANPVERLNTIEIREL